MSGFEASKFVNLPALAQEVLNVIIPPRDTNPLSTMSAYGDPVKLLDLVGVSEGSRNTGLHRLACSLLNKYSKEEAYEVAWQINQTYKPPLPKDEFEKLFRSAKDFVTTNAPENQTSNYKEESLEDRSQREVNAAEIQRRAEEEDYELPYLSVLGVDGFFVKGWSHIVAGYPKTGKTELLVALCHKWCLEDETVLFFSEEPESIWRIRLRAYPQWERMTIVFAVGMDPKDIKDRIERGTEAIVVIDTTRNLLGLEDENNNSEVARKLLPIIAAARNTNNERQSKTLILMQHTRKSGGDNGHAIAGAHAFLGVVDIALELDRDPHAPKSDRRYLHGQGRINKVPELIFERKITGELEALGDPEKMEFDNVRTRVFELVTEEWQKTKEIWEQLKGDSQPSQEQVRKALVSLAKKGEIERDPLINEEAKGKIHKWSIPNPTSNESSSKLEVQSSDKKITAPDSDALATPMDDNSQPVPFEEIEDIFSDPLSGASLCDKPTKASK